MYKIIFRLQFVFFGFVVLCINIKKKKCLKNLKNLTRIVFNKNELRMFKTRLYYIR